MLMLPHAEPASPLPLSLALSHSPTLPLSLPVSVVIGGRVLTLLGDGESVTAGLSVKESCESGEQT